MAYVFTAVFTVRSLALSASDLPFANRLPCVHKASPLRSPFVQRSTIVQSDSMIFRLTAIHTSSYFNLFLITDETQCKEAHLSVVHLAFPQRSHIVYCAFTVHFVCAFALRLLSAFLHCSQYI